MSNENDGPVAALVGRYEGRGSWHDSAGESGRYSIVQTNEATERGLSLVVAHEHGDGSATTLHVDLEAVAPGVYRAAVAGKALGHGYAAADMVRFHLSNELGSMTEVGYRIVGSGALRGEGSCTRNSAGRFIMWTEELHEVGRVG